MTGRKGSDVGLELSIGQGPTRDDFLEQRCRIEAWMLKQRTELCSSSSSRHSSSGSSKSSSSIRDDARGNPKRQSNSDRYMPMFKIILKWITTSSDRDSIFTVPITFANIKSFIIVEGRG